MPQLPANAFLTCPLSKEDTGFFFFSFFHVISDLLTEIGWRIHRQCKNVWILTSTFSSMTRDEETQVKLISSSSTEAQHTELFPHSICKVTLFTDKENQIVPPTFIHETAMSVSPSSKPVCSMMPSGGDVRAAANGFLLLLGGLDFAIISFYLSL